MRFGKIKVYAHRLWNGEPIPIFRDMRVNRAIDQHEDRIRRRITKRRRIDAPADAREA